MVRVAFVHPDLGIGGAERAVIDAALALKSNGHQVHFYTAHHDPNHCFQETRDGTLNVTTVGDWLPRHIFRRCAAFCAYLRMIYVAFHVVFITSATFDVIFCDQISACIPVLRLSRKKIIFYCHFPDMLLTSRASLLKRIYRAPIDWLEEKTTGQADRVLVNSNFTANIFRDTFTTLSHVNLDVVYPIPNFSSFDNGIIPGECAQQECAYTFLSINRYERKKNLTLVIYALDELKARLGHLRGIQAIIAGGYDERVVENKEYYDELVRTASSAGLADHVTFLRSFSDAEKKALLASSTCLLYTPSNEHFGIVPLESMYMRCPVIAVNSGGPLETVKHGETGFLCEPTPAGFAQAMEKFLTDSSLREMLGRQGRDHVTRTFSFQAYASKLDRLVAELAK